LAKEEPGPTVTDDLKTIFGFTTILRQPGKFAEYLRQSYNLS